MGWFEPVTLNRVATDLQEAVMKTRMQPIGNAWAKLPRIVMTMCVAWSAFTNATCSSRSRGSRCSTSSSIATSSFYFEDAARRDVLERITRQLTPGGVLVLGGSETTVGSTDALVRRMDQGAGVYSPARVAPAAPTRHVAA